MIRPPSARLGLVSAEERRAVIAQSPVKGKYDTAVDSESAYEILKKRVEATAADHSADEVQGGWVGKIGSVLGAIFGTHTRRSER
jgi:hypothetical protein